MFATYLAHGKFKSQLIFARINGLIVLQACAVKLNRIEGGTTIIVQIPPAVFDGYQQMTLPK